MIRELIDYYMTPSSTAARNGGFLYEAVAFESRARRHRHAWQNHWSNCHQVTRQFIEQHPNARSIAIFGSGCLFEVPVDDLAKRFQKIVLVDQVFPRSVRQWVKKNAGQCQIEMLEFDLTKATGSISRFRDQVACDLVISANLLSQIALAPVARRLKVGPISEAEEIELRRELQHEHLKLLAAWKDHAILWTDTRRDAKGSQEVLSSEQTVFLPLENTFHEWTWNLAPAPEISRDFDLNLAMSAAFIR